MMPGYDTQRIRRQLLVWWIIWAAILSGLVVIYLAFAAGRPLPPGGDPAELPLNLAGVVPLFVSIVLRWLVLPRLVEPVRALVLFIAGVSLAEACGLLGIFLGGPYRDMLFLLGLLGIVQWVPFYARKIFDPKGSGYIPNN
jgi:hypothetical protein